jgi:uncharacterized protein (TIGR00369 family)
MQHPAPQPKPMNPHEKATPMAHGAQNNCFGCGLDNSDGLRLEFYREEDGTVVCFVEIPSKYEGPPNYVHGGVIATLLDEAMSKAVRAKNVPAMTRSMEIDYRRPVPSRTPLRIEGVLVRSEERKHWTEARILDGKGTILADGKGLFVQVRASRMGIREERPEGHPSQEKPSASESC